MTKRLFYLIIFALILRLSYLFVFLPLLQSFGIDLYLYWDADGYQNHAQALHEGPFWFPTEGNEDLLRRMPLYPALLAFWDLLPLPYVPFIQCWHAFLDCITLLCLFLATKKLFNESTATIAAGLYAIYPLAIYRLPMFGTEVIHTTALAMFALVFVHFLSSKSIRHLVGLSLLSLTILFITPVFQFYVIFLTLALFVFVPKLQAIKFCLIYLLPILLIVFLWGLRNQAATGDFYLFDVRGGKEFWLGNNVESNGEWEGPYRDVWEAEMHAVQQKIKEMDGTKNDENRYFYKKGLEEIVSNPKGVAVLWYKKFFRFWYIPASKRMVWLTIPIQSFYLILALIGCVYGIKQNRQVIWILSIIAYYTAIYTLSYACIRFNHPIMPWVCMLSAVGMVNLWQKWKGIQQ